MAFPLDHFDFDRPTEVLVALRQFCGIGFERYDLVAITVNVEHRRASFGEWFQAVDRVVFRQLGVDAEALRRARATEI